MEELGQGTWTLTAMYITIMAYLFRAPRCPVGANPKVEPDKQLNAPPCPQAQAKSYPSAWCIYQFRKIK